MLGPVGHFFRLHSSSSCCAPSLYFHISLRSIPQDLRFMALLFLLGEDRGCPCRKWNIYGRTLFTCECNTWESQRCYPYAKSIPGDQVIPLYLVPLTTQSIIRGVSIQALFLSWAANIIFVIIATAHVGGYLELRTIIYSIIFVNISYVIE